MSSADGPGQRPRAPGMYDVARAAGVSHQTVSRVLNAHPRVREETRARVLAAIETLGYRRNTAARALVTRRSGTIGVITARTALYGPTSVMLALEAAAREAGYFVSLVSLADTGTKQMQAALEHYRRPDLRLRPAVLAVEPTRAACVTRSLAAGELANVDTSVPTIMAGLNCGTVSAIAWPAIRAGLDAGISVTDEQAQAAVAELSALGVEAGACGAASLAGVRVALEDEQRRHDLGITADSVVVLLSTEAGGVPQQSEPDGESP